MKQPTPSPFWRFLGFEDLEPVLEDQRGIRSAPPGQRLWVGPSNLGCSTPGALQQHMPDGPFVSLDHGSVAPAGYEFDDDPNYASPPTDPGQNEDEDPLVR